MENLLFSIIFDLITCVLTFCRNGIRGPYVQDHGLITDIEVQNDADINHCQILLTSKSVSKKGVYFMCKDIKLGVKVAILQ